MNIDFLFSFSIIALFVVYLFFKVPKGERTINLVLFSVICAPGFFLEGQLINISDILIPILFAFGINKYRKANFTKTKLIKPLMAFFACIVLSQIYALFNGTLSFGMVLKAIRFFEVILATGIIYYEVKIKNNLKYLFQKTIVYSFLLCIICLVLFFYQDSQFSSIQYMWIGDLVLHRAGGIYTESSNLGFNMLLIFVLSLYSIHKKNMVKTSYCLMILSVLLNALSYTRITNLALIAVVLFYFLDYITLKKIIALCVALVLLAVFYFSFDIVKVFINERLLGLFTNSLENSASGRFDVWADALEKFKNSKSYLFGLGYKLDYFFTDNCFLFALTSTGLLGLMCFLWFIINIFLISFQMKRKVFGFILFISFLIVSMTCDVLTYSRAMILMMFLIYNFSYKSKPNILTSVNLDYDGIIDDKINTELTCIEK